MIPTTQRSMKVSTWPMKMFKTAWNYSFIRWTDSDVTDEKSCHFLTKIVVSSSFPEVRVSRTYSKFRQKGVMNWLKYNFSYHPTPSGGSAPHDRQQYKLDKISVQHLTAIICEQNGTFLPACHVSIRRRRARAWCATRRWTTMAYYLVYGSGLRWLVVTDFCRIN